MPPNPPREKPNTVDAIIADFRSHRLSKSYLDQAAAVQRGIDHPWCVVVTKRDKEGAVQAALALAGWETYLPMKTLWARPSRLKKRVRQPLFPRYLFAACSPEGDLAATAEIEEVVKVHRSPMGRTMVRLDLLARMMLAEANHGFDLTYELPRPVHKTFLRGDTVKVTGGALGDYNINAVIEKELNAREVIAVYVLFGRAGVATFSKANLERLERCCPS
jgi:transcription antitermination factor NusG